MMSMTFSGVASKIESFPVTTKGSTSNSYITNLLLDSSPVRIDLKNPPQIRDGDNVIVVGNKSKGVFVATGYANQTTKVFDHPAGLSSVALSIYGFLLAVFLQSVVATQYYLQSFSFFINIFAALFYLGALLMLCIAVADILGHRKLMKKYMEQQC